jgi:hypothetical protein
MHARSASPATAPPPPLLLPRHCSSPATAPPPPLLLPRHCSSARRRLSACLHLRRERGDLRVGEVQRHARLLRGLRRERLDPAEHDRWRSVVGAGSASAAASAARANASSSTTSARTFSSAVPASKLLFTVSFDTWDGCCDVLLTSAAPWLVGALTPTGRYFHAPTAALPVPDGTMLSEPCARTGLIGIGKQSQGYSGTIQIGSRSDPRKIQKLCQGASGRGAGLWGTEEDCEPRTTSAWSADARSQSDPLSTGRPPDLPRFALEVRIVPVRHLGGHMRRQSRRTPRSCAIARSCAAAAGRGRCKALRRT